MNLSILKKNVQPPLERGLYAKQNIISDQNLIFSALFSITGLIVALLVNWLFPQIADVEIKPYELNPFGLFTVQLNITQAYGIVLFTIILIYAGIAAYSFFDNDRRKKFIKRAPFRFACGIALTVWDILGTKTLLLPQPFFPGPSRILEALLLEGGFVLENTLYSLRLFAAGFFSGVVIGIATGILIGWFPKVFYWVYPVLKITGVIPAVAWMPFALTLFPTPFLAATFLIVICAWFPVAFLTAQGIAGTHKVYYEVAKTLGAKTSYLVFRVAIPNALPQIFTGITTANAFAFTTLVICEMMGQPGGLGYYINASRVWSAYYKVFAAIIIMAILFSLIVRGFGAIQHWVLRWQRGLVK
ncbi:ABC transporter permease [Clostridiales bacterium BAD-6]|uniref:ABC transporter permease n=1 Tax=Sinanaerobacter chloroacetimidivorans TaxID=2818044 RepID=A0A8J8B4L8_9FIRM|nr:ABC transporter permease [Sinanaerobacter chloroacetimidivorans]